MAPSWDVPVLLFKPLISPSIIETNKNLEGSFHGSIVLLIIFVHAIPRSNWVLSKEI